MKAGITFILFIALLNLLGCSGDNTENLTPKPVAKQSAPSPVEIQPTAPYPNSPTAQDIQPDLHVSGVLSNHISGANETSEHLSGQ